MKALIKEAGAVQLVDVPRPEPRRPDEVLVQVLVAGICRTDLHVAAGSLPSADPITLGHEFAGRVVETTSRHIAVGDLVTAHPAIESGFLGVTHHGAFAEYVLVPAANLYKLPPALDPRAGAYVEPIAAALAAPELVHAERDVRFPAGTIGPRWRGIVLGTSRFARLVRDVTSRDRLHVELLASGRPRAGVFDFAIETSGTAAELAVLVDALEPGGLLVLKSRNPRPVEVPLAEIVQKGLTLRARHYGSFANAVSFVANGTLELRDLFGETFPLARHREAFARATEDESRKYFLSCAD